MTAALIVVGTRDPNFRESRKTRSKESRVGMAKERYSESQVIGDSVSINAAGGRCANVQGRSIRLYGASNGLICGILRFASASGRIRSVRSARLSDQTLCSCWIPFAGAKTVREVDGFEEARQVGWN